MENNEETLIVHCGKKNVIPQGELSVDAVPAIHVSTSYLFDSAEQVLQVSKGSSGYVYQRCGNENCTDLAMAVSQLEGAADGVCFACGMGAISSAFIAAGILTGNKKVLGPFSCYGSSYTLMKTHFTSIATCELTDMGDTEGTLNHIRSLKPDILYMETSSNPLTIVPEIAQFVAEAKRVNPNAVTIIDNTYATPLLVKPVLLGVDLVLHSMTKYLNGHGDALAGIIVSNNMSLMAAVRQASIDFGAVLSPWDAWMVQRGLRTLGVRMEAIGRNALQVAKYLENSEVVSRVHYPGLPSHPQFRSVLKNAARAYSADEIKSGFPFSGMIAFDINIPDEQGVLGAKLFLDSLKLISNQVSLGDVKSLASAPGLSTQHQVPLEERKLIGIRSTTIRLSIGMENINDICQDINQALEVVVVQLQCAPLPPTLLKPTLEQGLSDLSVVEKSDTPLTDTQAVVAAEVSYSSVLAQRTARLKVLYDQMTSITSEMETIQTLIKRDSKQMLQQQQDLRP